MPFDEEPVGGQAAVQGAGGDAIKVGNVAAADCAEAIDVEMGVFGFERIEGPFDDTNAAVGGVLRLKEFEIGADTAVAVRRKNAGHVRVKVGRLTMDTDIGLGETDHKVTVECAEHLAA